MCIVITLIVSIVLALIVLLFLWSRRESFWFTTSNICYHAHSKTGLNHPWLRHIHGGLSLVTWADPTTKRQYEYTDNMWMQHCNVCDHNPLKLVQSHMYNQLLPTPIYHFNDGTVLQQTREILQMEADWFTRASQQSTADDSAA